MKLTALTVPTLALALFLAPGISSTASANVAPAVTSRAEVHVDGRKVLVVKRRPPVVRVEVRTPRPSRRHVWVGGHWHYRGGRFVWIRGHWVVRPHARAVFVRPRWSRQGDGWVFVSGYWR